MKIFETHCHLDFEDYDSDREQVLKDCQKAGVDKLINVGCDGPSSERSVALAGRHDFIWAACGWHPHDADKYDEAKLRDLLKMPRVVALGEIGLDYYRNLTPRDVQKETFARQLELALELKLPVIIHDREAHEDCLSIMRHHGVEKAVFHCFSGDVLFAEKVIDAGYHISFTGTVTYKNSNAREVVRLVPRDRFFVETDSPYLTPEPYRGKRNHPAYLQYVVQALGSLRGVPPIVIARAAYENAEAFFLKK